MTTPSIAVRHDPAWTTLGSWRTFLSHPSAAAGVAAAAVGIVVLLGWLLGLDVLRSLVPGQLTMKANTAVCLVLLGAGIALMSRSTGTPRGSIGLLLVAAVAVIALVTGGQFVTGIDVGIDRLLWTEPRDAVGTLVPGRMSPATAICFVLLALAALAAPRSRRTVIVLCGSVLATSALFMFDFVFGAQAPRFLAGYTGMAFGTSLATSILAFGIIGLLGPANPFLLLSGRSTTLSLLRRLLVVLVIATVVMAWLRIEGQQLGLYDTSFGTSLMLVGILALAVIAILRAAAWAAGIEVSRAASELERDRFFDLSLDMLSVVDADGRYRRVNRAWETVLGYPAGELIGRQYLDLVHPDDLDRTIAEGGRLYEEGEVSVGFQNRVRHRDGSYRWLEWMSHTPPDRSVAFGVARDITDRKRAEDRRAMRQRVLEHRNEALSERTLRDALTGLHNRRFFDAEVDRLEGRWGHLSDGERPPVSVIIFDLDHFGEVNNQHGHQAGDAVLRYFAELLRTRFREHDLVARYGGEEFVVVLEGATSADALRAAEDIRETFGAALIDVGTGTPIRVTVSAGCAQLGDGWSTLAGLSQADVWLAQAKRAGRNQVLGL